MEIIDHFKVGKIPLEIDLILKKTENMKKESQKSKSLGTFAKISDDGGAKLFLKY